MRGDQARVVNAFCAYLQGEGWDVEREVRYVAVKAAKGPLALYAEARAGPKRLASTSTLSMADCCAGFPTTQQVPYGESWFPSEQLMQPSSCRNGSGSASA